MEAVGQPLLRADSWNQAGVAALIKTGSDVMAHMVETQGVTGGRGPLGTQAPPLQLERQKQFGGPSGPSGAPQQLQPVPGARTNSTDSTSTAARHTGPPVVSLGCNLLFTQASLDAIAATGLLAAADECEPEARGTIFQDVLEQLAMREAEHSAPRQGGLYTLPSIKFLECLLDDMDSRSASNGRAPEDPPLYLPADFDDPLPDFKPTAFEPLAHHHQQQQQQQQHGGTQQQQQHGGSYFNVHAAALAHQQPAMPAPGAARATFVPTSGHEGLAPAPPAPQPTQRMPTAASGALPSYLKASAGGSAALRHDEEQRQWQVMAQLRQAVGAATVHSRVAMPAASPMRRVASAYTAMDYEDAEVSIQTSKSGRVRKVASFTGVKRKSTTDLAGYAHQPSMAAAAGGGSMQQLPSLAGTVPVGNTISESRDTSGSMGHDSGDEVSKGSKGSRKVGGGGGANKAKKGKRTVCLNCGCHQTPQWRCGPLGPRTLCNACGVRFKKGLPLNCWPIRDGMVLPQGAVLPVGIQIPPGVRIHIQPADSD